jgi:heme/copper-type cytochrome/quinol oxidase subunit 3
MSAPAVALPGRTLRPSVPTVHRRGPGGSNVVVGTLIFLAAEVMLFAGLVSAFLVLRAQAPAWPTLDRARFPLELTAANLLLLLLSGRSVVQARSHARRGARDASARWVLATAAAGVVFLAVQSVEWVRLVHVGLGATSGVYGALFATLIGMHGVHVLGGVCILVVVGRALVRGRLGARTPDAVTAASLYWQFVVAVWPILWALLYLT